MLPQPGWRRFRLSALPAEPTRPAPARGSRWLGVGAWLLFCAAGLLLSDPALASLLRPGQWWSAAKQGSAGQAPADQPGLAGQSGAAGLAHPAAAAAVSSALAPPRTARGLAPIGRVSPTVHQGDRPGASGASDAYDLNVQGLDSEVPTQYGDTLSAVSSFAGSAPVGTMSSVRLSLPAQAPLLHAPLTGRAPGPERPSAASATRVAGEPAAEHAAAPTRAERAALAPESKRSAQEDDAPAAPARVWTQHRGKSCDSAYAEHVTEMNVEHASAPDLPAQAFAQVLENFEHYASCDLSRDREINICVAVHNGQAKGVTVKTQPADARLAACIAGAVQRLRFPRSAQMDLVRTTLTVQ